MLIRCIFIFHPRRIHDIDLFCARYLSCREHIVGIRVRGLRRLLFVGAAAQKYRKGH